MLVILRNYESLGMKLRKVNQSKIALKKDGAIQFEPAKNANTFKGFYSELTGNLVSEKVASRT